MEASFEQNKQAKDYEEEHVLLDLGDVCVQADIPPNAPYALSGLDTLNPVLVIGDRLKLIGEYQETMGTCYLFSERDEEKVVLHPETGESERNLFKETSIVDPTPVPSKQVKPVASLHKVLKFRLANEGEAKT
ncbi:uncharacterized protein A4U43_C04F34510 [Asparagus officinalis]|uniref:Transcription factor TFIIIC triple barrel domain-containing protein n=1 Tax=Asparagus officinalis TaxID=4686 RepID=A0A5P1F5Q4_ASPOF|nr:uncharacterized protein LOC109839599 [Asparagus officinalis]XP_020263680.1 uncharacterized protein LOC109839599 [Asparagus officinalis]ONK73715.1 uncharacterized protein A4U43_C04F34510 [Asparagus officinalis]